MHPFSTPWKQMFSDVFKGLRKASGNEWVKIPSMFKLRSGKFVQS